MNQTLKDIEIICIDDGSSDNSINILKKYAQKDNRITILTQQNLHAGEARNAGIKISTGEYVQFMDSDDYLEENALEKLYKKAKDNVDIVAFGYYQASEKEIEQVIPSNDLSPFSFEPNCWNKLFKRSLIENISFQNLKSCNDVFFTYYTLCCANSIVIMKEPLYYYRKNALGNISSSRGDKIENIVIAFGSLKKTLKQNKLYKKYQKSFYKRFKLCISYELSFVNDRFNAIKKIYKNFDTEDKFIFFINTITSNIFYIKNVRITDKIYKEFCLLGIKIRFKKGK